MKTGSMRAGRQDVSKTIGSNETLSSIEVGNLLRASPLSVELLRASTKRRILGRPSNDGLNPQLSVEIQREPLNGWERLIKRALDLVLAVVAAVLLAPVLLMTAVAIKMDSNGPVLFRQRRVGLDNKEFLIYKFRTMMVMDDDRGDDEVFGAGERRFPILGRRGGADRVGEARPGTVLPAAGDEHEVVGPAVQLLVDLGDQLVEPAGLADQPGERLA